ncbi:Flagellar assembly factor FliW [bioreactor metagenome]|uniref:Flagellar assembly factor FliW n=1 Tax=bioreactor metagenome TaxID=1076179 RepID=A0A644X4R8_9ZZZZ
MKILTAHFGEVEIDDKNILFFEKGLPGLEEDKRYALLSNENSRPVSWLQSLDHTEISLPVMDPFSICPNYSFDISSEDVDKLEIEQIKDIYVINILVIPQNADAMTINLSAPIIINVRNKKGCQIILDDRKYRVRVPVKELLGKPIKDGI